MVNILKDFCEIVVVREKSRTVSINGKPADRLKLLTTVAIGNPPVMSIDITRPVSIMLVIALNNFIFWLGFHILQLHKANILQI